VVELFIFLEMRNAASRIEILTFKGTTPYTAAGLPHQKRRPSHEPLSRLARFRSTADVEHLDAGAQRRFDVQAATCTTAEDADKLLAVIEMCGSGFDTFNGWNARPAHRVLAVRRRPLAVDDHLEPRSAIATTERDGPSVGQRRVFQCQSVAAGERRSAVLLITAAMLALKPSTHLEHSYL
jgi:hypothetical protein